MKINKIDNTRLRNDEHFQYCTELKALVEETGAGVLGIAAQFALYIDAYNVLDLSFKKITKSIYTKRIDDAGKARGLAWSGLMKIHKAGLISSSAAKKEAADMLKILFGAYGNILKKPRNEQTSAFYNILQELKGAYAGSVQAIDALSWVQELEARNISFSNLMRLRYDEAGARNRVAVKSARAETDRLCSLIIDIINHDVFYSVPEGYAHFINTFNEVTAKYRAMLRKRSKPKAAAKAAAKGAKN